MLRLYQEDLLFRPRDTLSDICTFLGLRDLTSRFDIGAMEARAAATSPGKTPKRRRVPTADEAPGTPDSFDFATQPSVPRVAH